MVRSVKVAGRRAGDRVPRRSGARLGPHIPNTTAQSDRLPATSSTASADRAGWRRAQSSCACWFDRVSPAARRPGARAHELTQLVAQLRERRGGSACPELDHVPHRRTGHREAIEQRLAAAAQAIALHRRSNFFGDDDADARSRILCRCDLCSRSALRGPARRHNGEQHEIFCARCYAAPDDGCELAAAAQTCVAAHGARNQSGVSRLRPLRRRLASTRRPPLLDMRALNP